MALIPLVLRGAPWDAAFNTWKIDKALAVSEPNREMHLESPYVYVAKIEVSDLDAMVNFLGTDESQKFVKSWSVLIDPKAIFTLKWAASANQQRFYNR